MMNPNIAQNALILLQRVDLKGNEAQVYLQVVAALESIVREGDDNVSEGEPSFPPTDVQ